MQSPWRLYSRIATGHPCRMRRGSNWSRSTDTLSSSTKKLPRLDLDGHREDVRVRDCYPPTSII